MKERILYFDLLKGTAIFLVVMGHALTMCIRDIDAAPLFKIVSQVHSPTKMVLQCPNSVRKYRNYLCQR